MMRLKTVSAVLLAPMLVAGTPSEPERSDPPTPARSDLTEDYLEVVTEGSDAVTTDGNRGTERIDEPEGQPRVDGPPAPPPPYEGNGDFIMRLSCGPEQVWLEWALFTPLPDGSVQKSVIYERCEPISTISTRETPPTMTPEIAGELVRRELPRPTFEMNPRAYAVTGIETWVWYGDDGRLALREVDHDSDPSTAPLWGASVTATDAVGFNTVTATVWISEYRWDMGDGTVIRSATPGSAESPAGEHLYTETAEENVVTASTVWTGTWSSTAGGIANGSGTLGPVVVTGAPTDYPVYQVRSAPVGRR